MRGLTASLFCFALLQVTGLPARQAPATTPVLINVTDQVGSSVPGAQIRVVPAPDQAPGKMETDSKGHLSLNLKPGGYALFVRSPGFASFATHIEVHGSGETETIPVALQIAPSGSPKVVYPASDKDALFLTCYPYHEDVLIKPAEFKSFPRITVTIHNAHSNADETYSGVPLAEILARYGAPLGKELRGIVLNSYVVGTGSDGYSAVLSLAEVDPTFHPGTVLVADSLNGRPLDAKSGPYQLVVSEDKRPARCVRNLITLELKPAH